MSSPAKQKIIFTDSGKDIAITGQIIAEDDFFLTVQGEFGKTYKIGKKAVVCIKGADF